MARAGAVIDAPPSRYRVVERGRRLEVVDTATGTPVGAPGSAKPVDKRGIAALLPRRPRFDGTAELRTSKLYDRNAPRTVVLIPARTALLRWTGLGVLAGIVAFIGLALLKPWLLSIPVISHFAGVGPGLRKKATKWLDDAEVEGWAATAPSPRR